MKKRILLGAALVCAMCAVVATAFASSTKHSATGLPSSSCQKVQYGGLGNPQYLIASDLPLQGANRALTTEMAKAVAYVLDRQGWKAGKYTVGFQSCDDSTAQAGGYDTAKCTANANAYVADSSVLGIVGTFNSGCAKIEIPINNRGSVSMVSPSNTYPGLTVGGPGTAPGEPTVYYPTGKRNYARVVWTDRSQGAADVLFAKQRLHLKNIYVLTDKTTYGAGIASIFQTDAKTEGVKIAGFQAWNVNGTSFQSLATAVKQSGADGVFLGGNVCFQGGKVIKDLRSVLGANFPIIVPDGFTPLSATWTTSGGAALGVYNSQPGVPITQLSGAGAKFAHAFAVVNGGKAPDPYTIYAAQAASVLLSAIAASDGTRAGVIAHLTNLSITNGLLGNFKINKNGDTTLGTVTFYQVVNNKASGYGKFVELLTPPTSLTGT
jgi:branched-chain amino acid transport system substrate-binding protein